MLQEYDILVDKIIELCRGKKNIAVFGPAGNELTVRFLSFAMARNSFNRGYTIIELVLKYTRWNTLTISSSDRNFQNDISHITFNVLKPHTQFDSFLKTALEVVTFLVKSHNGGGKDTKLPYESVMDYIDTLASLNNNI